MGQELVFVPTCYSTNSLALQRAQQQNTVEGTLVITDNQTAGRGQQGNFWEAQPGKNLTFSLLLTPTFLQPKDQFYLNMVISLGIYDYLSPLVHTPVTIKWPNDILIANRKVSGILIENVLNGGKYMVAVVGIGLNVNQLDFKVGGATSLRLETSNDYILSDELDEVLGHIEARYLMLKRGDFSRLVEDYLQRLLGYQQKLLFEVAGQPIEGIINGIDEAGRLKVRFGDLEKFFNNKEIKFLKYF